MLRLLALLLPLPAMAYDAPPIKGSGGMVAADNTRASEAGAQALRDGGDAADAAVVTALVLGVVHPFASGLGGGGFAVVYRADGKRYALDFREVAPAGAHKDMYLDDEGEVIPKASTRGPRAVAVPAELKGLYELHKRHGKLPWKRVVAPALKLAREGFPASPLLHERASSKLKQITARPPLAELYLVEGKPTPTGHIVKRPKLPRTLEAIAKQGSDALYKGDVGAALAAAMKADGGLVSMQDLAKYSLEERRLVEAEWQGKTLLSMPPPSSGGAVIVQVLRVLGDTDLKALGHNSSAYIHRLTEALKHAFADRARTMGDPAFSPVPLEAWLGDEAINRARRSFRPDATHPRGHYGGRYGVPEDGGTTHFSVLDGQGNAIALTSTINTSFGSMYMAGDTGLLLNNEMDDFVSKPGVPNAYGLIGRAANQIQPGKRPLSSMSPTIVVEKGKAVLVLGGSGGPRIITGTLQVLLNTLVFGMHVRGAVEAPRIHHQWVPEILFIEPEIAVDVRDALRRRGHTLKRTKRYNAVQVIKSDAEGQEGASDPSKRGQPVPVKARW